MTCMAILQKIKNRGKIVYFVKRSFSGRYLSGFLLGLIVVLLHVVFAVGFLRMQIGEFKNSPEAFCPYYKWIMADTFWSLIFR